MKVEKINDRFYQEIDKSTVQAQLDQKILALKSIDFDSLKADYEANVTSLTSYKDALEQEIKELEQLLK